MRERFWSDGSAASQLLGFLVAGALFVATLSVVLVLSVNQESPTTKADVASAQSHAERLSALLIENTGEGWYAGGAKCDGLVENKDALSGDLVERLGIGAEPCATLDQRLPGNLSYDKITNLQRATIEADDANGRLDYEEARASLGLDEANLDFHIRTQPVLTSIRTLLETGYQDPNLKPMYIGDYEDDVDPLLPTLDVTEAAEQTTSGATYWVNVTNNGLIMTMFEVTLTLHLDDGDVDLVSHTPPLAPGETGNVGFAVDASADWGWSSASVNVVVSDPVQVLHEGAIDASSVTMTGSTTHKVFGVHTGKLQYELGGTSVDANVYYEAFTGQGEVTSHSDWQIEVYDALGLPVASDTDLHSRGWEAVTFLLPGVYDVYLKSKSSGETLAEDKIVVVTSELEGWSASGSSDWVPQASVPIEIAFVDLLIQQFEANAFHPDYDHASVPYAAGGDVYPDIKTVMNNDVQAMLIDDKGTPSTSDDEATLANYNVLVVGSHVDHQVMTSAAAKQAIRDWVYAGGTLIVLGSNDQAVQWLQPIFHSSISSASGGLSVPDLSHPVLTVPNDLDYEAYSSHGLAWDFSRPQDEEHFTHVIQQGDDHVLTLSDYGEFGAGRVLLSAYQAYDLMEGPEDAACTLPDVTAACDGIMLVHNLVTQAYAGLFLDYGPPLPTDRTVGASIRLASVWHPELEQSVALRVQIYVF